MRLDLTGRNVDITPALRQLLSGKLSRLERLMQDTAVSAQVVLSRERYRHITDITLHARGDNMLAGVGTGANWQSSMSEAVEKITQQAQRLKERWTSRKRRGGSSRTVPAPAVATESVPESREAPGPQPVRYAIRRHTIAGAVGRLERTSEPFVLFRNTDTMRLSLVFRQKDGRVGLIETDV